MKKENETILKSKYAFRGFCKFVEKVVDFLKGGDPSP
jgi:hypothetical protein